MTSQDWLAGRPEIKALRLAVADLNGVARGKRIPSAHADKAFGGALRMPYSVLNVDIWGADIENSPLVFDSGDADGTLSPTERGIVPITWLDEPSALIPLWMSTDDGTPFAGDARHALNAVLARYRKHGLNPVVATEMEFYLLDGASATPQPPRSPQTGRPLEKLEIMSLAGVDAFDGFFNDLYAACAAMNIPADAAISEAGLGQFEINLLHGDDALKAADDAWFFKMAARGVARKHGMVASFMAKPYPDQPGNGLHTHFSILDQSGQNIFDPHVDQDGKTLQNAVAGVLAFMRPSALIFAPHFNSYRRMCPDSHAPTAANWGFENRTTSVRIPGGNPKARRIEHRVAGGDTNPYLMLAAVLGAALVGLTDKLEPCAPTTGNAYATDQQRLPQSWETAIDLFQSDPAMARLFPAALVENLVMCKRQELLAFSDADPDFEYAAYLETV